MAHQLTLNQQQLQAVKPKNGTFLVVAGAGSGKTRIITARIAHLITKHKAHPSSLVALTFTNKAAKEMKERVEHILDHPVNPFIGTFHAYCLSLLKKESVLFGGRPFSILDSDDKNRLLKKLIYHTGLDKKMSPKQAGHQISIIKNNSLDASQHELLHQNRFLAQLYALYEQERKASHSLDFDDLLLEALKLFNNPNFKKEFHHVVSHVLVDEYQDTNRVQHELLKQMTLGDKKRAESLCAVGDEDQSIYSWRGATVANILNFKHDFSPATVITVEQNYRSVTPILDVAHAVIKHNKKRNPKRVWSERVATNRIKAVHCFSEYQEADALASCIKTLPSKKRNNCAILYRAHFQSRALEEALVKNSIPYRILGGVQFYERKEIKDVLAYLRLVVNPFDRVSFFRAINCPVRGLGPKFEELFHTIWTQQPLLNFKEVGRTIIKQKKVTGVKKKSLEHFIAYFEDLEYKSSAYKALENIIKRAGFISHLKNNYEPEDAQGRIDNLQELSTAFEHFASQDIKTISQVLEEISLLTDNYLQKEQDTPVLLMTLHAAKGLEFDTVIIAGVQEGLLPNSRSLTEEEIEEERRLLYVGITRAQEHLLLTCSEHRARYAATETHTPSRFLDETPSHLVKLQDARYWRTDDFFVFFSDWLGTNYSYRSSTVKTFRKKITTKKTLVDKGSDWKVRQPVQHQQFGVGIVEQVDAKQNKAVYLTIKFRSSRKKIDSRFVSKV